MRINKQQEEKKSRANWIRFNFYEMIIWNNNNNSNNKDKKEKNYYNDENMSSKIK